MHWNELIDIAPAKVEALRARIARLGIDLAQVGERFVRGGGRGGQKINKTASCVQLDYPPLGLRVRCQRERRRSLNRFLALRELVDQVEMKVSPGTSARLQERDRVRKAKDRARRRADRNETPAPPSPAPGEPAPQPPPPERGTERDGRRDTTPR
jgi:protein subunit release factor B